MLIQDEFVIVKESEKRSGKTEQVKCETQLIRKPSKPVDTTETEEEGFTMSKFAAGSQFETKAEKRAKEEKKLQN